MSSLSLPGASAGSGRMTIRRPDLSNRRVMTTRAWWLIVLNVLVPGSAQLLAGSRRLGRFGVGATFVLWFLVVTAAVLFSFWQAAFITVVTNYFALWAIQAAMVFYAVLWVILTFDTVRLVKLVRVGAGARAIVAGLTAVSIVVVGGAALYGTSAAGVARDTLGNVFAGSAVEPPVDGRYNILLLGGDAGADRAGLRPDSISVVSIEADTGKSTIIGVPRNLQYAPFSADSPMLAEYPNGYGTEGCEVDACMINSIYTEVELYTPDLYPNAVSAGSEPGIEAMRDAVQGVLGITIQYYVIIDMQGFAELIDALGGITLTVESRLPITDEVDENGQPYTEVTWIEAGKQKMDGGLALAYARIRAGTTDYDRMQRQRQVQEALLQQFEPTNVLLKFQDIAKAGQQVISTDVPQGMLGTFVGLAVKARPLGVSSVELVPPDVDPDDPDYEYVRTLVSEALVLTTPDSGG